MKLTFDLKTSDSFSLTFNRQGSRRSFLCHDTYVLATPRTIFTPVIIGLFDHTVTHKKVDAEKMASILN